MSLECSQHPSQKWLCACTCIVCASACSRYTIWLDMPLSAICICECIWSQLWSKALELLSNLSILKNLTAWDSPPLIPFVPSSSASSCERPCQSCKVHVPGGTTWRQDHSTRAASLFSACVTAAHWKPLQLMPFWFLNYRPSTRSRNNPKLLRFWCHWGWCSWKQDLLQFFEMRLAALETPCHACCGHRECSNQNLATIWNPIIGGLWTI